MSYDLDDIIEHYGVKGMKWGVRKDPDRVSVGKKVKSAVKDYLDKTAPTTYTDMDGNTWTTTGNMNRAKEKELRAKARKQAKMEKKADKKWEKGMTGDKIHKAMADSDSRTRKQQDKLESMMRKSDLFKRAQSGDRQAMQELNVKWTMEYANILNKDMRKQAELKSPSGKKALEIMIARIGDEPYMAPRIVDKE